MRAVDTNVLVRLVTGDDPDRTASAESFVAPGAWVSHLVLAETAWVLTAVYRVGPTAIATAVEMLLNHATLTLQDADVARAALHHFRTASGVSFSDCLVLEVARKNGHLPLGTFDRHLARLDGAQRL